MLAVSAGWHDAIHSPVVWVLTAVIAILFPAADSIMYSRLQSTIALYLWNVAAEWSLAIACLWALRKIDVDFRTAGLNSGTLVGSAAGLLAVIALALLLVAIKAKKKAPDTRELNQALNRVRKLLPVSSLERSTYIVVAMTAGMCEELLYRGWMLNVTAGAFRSIVAGAVISSLLFGFAHLYQGRSGITSASLLGLVFALLYILSGSLLIPTILHAALDLNNGLALGRVAAQITADRLRV